MTEGMSLIRKGVQKRLAPNGLFWKFDSQDRGGTPYRVFLDLHYRGKAVVVDWCALSENEYCVTYLEDTCIKEDTGQTVSGVEATISLATEMLDPDATASSKTH